MLMPGILYDGGLFCPTPHGSERSNSFARLCIHVSLFGPLRRFPKAPRFLLKG